MPARLALTLFLAAGCAHLPPEAAPASLRLYLARHGQTDWNVEQRVQGWTDRHLNDTGRAQAAALAGRLRGIRLDAVYCSALSRSRETAEVVHGEAPLQALQGLNEHRMGVFEGTLVGPSADPVTLAEFKRRTADPDDDLGGGESGEAFSQRVRGAVEGILRRHPSGSVLVVGHGGTNAEIVRALFGLTREQASGFKQANDELYLIELGPSGPPRLWKLASGF